MALHKLGGEQWNESTARRHLKSPRSLSSRSLHLTLVTTLSWSWSIGHEWPTPTPFIQCQSALPFWDTAIHGQGHVCGQMSRSHLTLKIQRSWSWSRSNPLVTFEAWSSIDIFPLRFAAIGLLLVNTLQILHLFWKFKVKVMAKAKSDGHIWGLKFNRYICFSFRGNRTIFGWEIAYLTLKIHGQGHGQGQTHWSHLRPWVHSIRLLFVSWQSDHFWLRYSKFYIWPWKFKVMLISDGHIWGIEFNRYVCFSFRVNWTIFGWDIANSTFDRENWRWHTTKINQNLIRY